MTEWFKNLLHLKQKFYKQTEKSQSYTNEKQFEQQALAHLNSGNDQKYEPSRSPQIQNNVSNLDRDSDEDSLGYTQNQWDEETINFQLEDRMLDCLEEQKYVNSYRESLIFANSLTGKPSKRFTRKPILQPHTQNQTNQISIEAIIEEQFPDTIPRKSVPGSIQNNNFAKGSNSINKNVQTIEKNLTVQSPFEKAQQSNQQSQEKKPENKSRRNRFSKYMKKGQLISTQQSSWLNHLGPLDKADSFVNTRAQQIFVEPNESYEDYMNRVLNLKITSEDKAIQKAQQQLSEIHQVQGPEQQRISVIAEKSSSISDTSFAVFDPSSQLHSISISEISSNNQNNSNSNQQNPLHQTHQQSNPENQSNLKSNSQQLLPTIDSVHQIQSFNQIQNQPFPNQEPPTLHSHKKLTPKIYHILTPPKHHSVQSISYLSQQKPNLINSISSNEDSSHKKIPFQKPKFIQQSPQPAKINFISSSENLPQFISQQNQNQLPKSPRAKVIFNYGVQNQSQQNTNNIKKVSFPTSTPIYVSPLTKPVDAGRKEKVRIIYNEPKPEQRFPIFLRRLRRINSCYPNLWVKGVNKQKINQSLKMILKAMQSAILVIELLYKKLCIQKTKLHQPFVKAYQIKSLTEKQADYRGLLQQEIMNIFMKSQWQTNVIQQIQYIKPKQQFKRRVFDGKKFQEVMQSYNKFIDHYLNESSMPLNTSQQIKRYYRIREKTSTIVQNLRIISQDLYTFWLIECNYPELYYDLLDFLKLSHQNNPYKYRQVCDEIYAKIIVAEQCNDPLCKSIVGRTALEKIQSAYQSAIN